MAKKPKTTPAAKPAAPRDPREVRRERLERGRVVLEACNFQASQKKRHVADASSVKAAIGPKAGLSGSVVTRLRKKAVEEYAFENGLSEEVVEIDLRLAELEESVREVMPSALSDVVAAGWLALDAASLGGLLRLDAGVLKAAIQERLAAQL